MILDAPAIEEAVRLLREGGVVAHPADTCFGLAADPANPAALEKVRRMKGRDALKPMSLMLPAGADLERYARLSAFAAEVAKKLFPGPVTLLVPRGPDIPLHYFPETQTVGLRVPENALMQALAAGFGGPLITTSANRSGGPSVASAAEVEAQFVGQPEKPDLILHGPIPGACLPSTVIEVGDGHLKIVRPGPVTVEHLRELFGASVVS